MLTDEVLAYSGTLTGAEQLRFARAAVKSQIQSLPGIIRALLGRGEASAVASDAAPPDSALATNALEFVEELYPASLFHHCLRCWYFGDFFAQIAGTAMTRSCSMCLYVSCLFHDIALSNRYRDSRHYGCFAYEAGEVAKSWLTGRLGTSNRIL